MLYILVDIELIILICCKVRFVFVKREDKNG